MYICDIPFHTMCSREHPFPADETATAEPLLVEGDANDPGEFMRDGGGATNDAVGFHGAVLTTVG